MTIFIGVDGGLLGAIAVISDTRTFGTSMPTYNTEVKTKRGLAKRKRYDLRALRTFFAHYTNQLARGNDTEWYDAEYNVTQCHVTLEEAFPVPMKRETKEGEIIKQGAVSVFSTGLGYGIMQGLLTGLNMDYDTVHPKKWQARFGIRTSEESTTKEQALVICEQLFPNVNLMASERSTTPHKGIVDALLIAEYGKRRYEEGLKNK